MRERSPWSLQGRLKVCLVPRNLSNSLGAQESTREWVMDILKELFGTSDELQISKSLFESDASSTPPVELGLGEWAREERVTIAGPTHTCSETPPRPVALRALLFRAVGQLPPFQMRFPMHVMAYSIRHCRLHVYMWMQALFVISEFHKIITAVSSKHNILL